MSEAPSPSPEPARLPDWEAFYRDYRKPGYVAGFEITSKLGGGMFGQVYRARKISIGKDYAIKFLQVEDGEVARAVLAELSQVQFFAQLDHPNLVSIEDRGEVDGIPYLVMSFAGTQTLRDVLPGAPPQGEQKAELLRYFVQACRGVAALHERSLVHFDLKPANVFLKGGVARVGDYGLSKLVTHSRGSLSMGRGTPYYMAPELLQRRGDAKSDVYSLGVMLYELLCGKVPFTGDSEWAVLKQHEQAVPEWPAHLTAVERAVMARCLQKDPAARFPSVHDLIAALGAPVATGAGALHEARQGATGGAAPRPASVKPAGDPYAGFRQASQEAFAHAQKVGREAMTHARAIAERAARDAAAAAREAAANSRHRGMRLAMVWPRLLKQRRDRKSRQAALRVAAAAVAGPAAASRRRWAGRTVALLGVMATIAAAMLVLFAVRSRPTYVDVYSLAPTLGSIYGNLRIPAEYMGSVSIREPQWAALAERDLAAARTELENHLQRLRAAVPADPELRAMVLDLPEFRPNEAWLAPAQQSRLAGLLDRLLQRDAWDQGLAAQLIAAAPQSLVLAAERLDGLQLRDDAAWRRAGHLHRLLVEATGCRDLALVPSADRKERERLNEHLGSLWKWYLNELANTPRAWSTYRRLQGR